ncbi:hypothetical protein ScPMuIL_012935 [Solemya velum]
MASSSTPSQCSIRARIIFSIIGIVAGLSVFIVFAAHYRNWNTSLWGLISACVASLTLYVHIQYVRCKWQTFPYQLRYWMLSGCLSQLVGVCGFTVYLTLAITEHQGLTAYGAGYYLTSVWCFMTLKWGFVLFYFSRSYKQLYYDIYTILPKDDADVMPYYTK